MIPPKLAHYLIVDRIGAGGMGEVYAAEDTRLGRRVALKVLPHDLASDPERRGRFEREARAIARLNHPNIVTIHSVEQDHGFLFLTMELVEGRTLERVIPREGMAVRELLDLAMPLVDAVASAHAGGITHRDLKPANVMVTDEGRVKVLDFGLAKVGEHRDTLATAPTRTGLTVEGHIVGTCAYMSPEQAEGRAVDTRTDIFSLGVVLYEMATGQRPFNGDTNLSVLSSILRDSPPRVSELRPGLPTQLARIIDKCLEKRPDDRYPTARELGDDLRRLEQDLESGTLERERPLAIASWRWFRIAAGSTLAVAVAAALWYLGSHWLRRTDAPFASITMRRLTSTGDASLAAISPDGKYVVHVIGPADRQSLWIRQVSTTSNVRIVPERFGLYGSLTFAPDGESVLYVFYPPNAPGSLFTIPLLGGTPREIVKDLDIVPAFSPDGRQMAFVRELPGQQYAVIIANASGTGERRLAARGFPDAFATSGLAWSPDGNTIAIFRGGLPGPRSRIVLLNVDTGRERQLGDARFDLPGRLAWLPDGSAIVFDAVERGGYRASAQVWSIAYPSGAVRRLTTDVANYRSLGMDRSGRSLVAVQEDVRTGLWVMGAGEDARQLTNSTAARDGVAGLDWTPDGRILYSAFSSGSWDIWIVDADGAHPRQVTSDPGMEANPRASPDGRAIVFQSRSVVDEGFQLRTVGLDGGTPRTIASVRGIWPGCLDVIGDRVYFKAMSDGQLVAYRGYLDGRPPAPLFAGRTDVPRMFNFRGVSPDERLASGTYLDYSTGKVALMFVSLDGSQPPRTIPVSGNFLWGAALNVSRWEPDSSAIDQLLFRGNTRNVWRTRLDGTETPVTTFDREGVNNFAWSRDGKMLALARGEANADVVIITGGDAAGR